MVEEDNQVICNSGCGVTQRALMTQSACSICHGEGMTLSTIRRALARVGLDIVPLKKKKSKDG